jgi:hypothetical protein
MDNFEQRLKQDAENIAADVSPELRSRIDATIRAGTAPATQHAKKPAGFRLWLAASLTGAAAAILVVTIAPRESSSPRPEQVGRAVPQYAPELERMFPLRAETAELTAPLEEELKNLQADIEKARENVEEDLEFTF